jgi:hypothetical protein
MFWGEGEEGAPMVCQAIPSLPSLYLLPAVLTSLLLSLAIEETGSLLAPRLCLAVKRTDVLPRDWMYFTCHISYIPSSARYVSLRRSPRGLPCPLPLLQR